MTSKAPLPSRYEGARLVARGGMGDIFVARDRVLGREVAVKVLIERFAADSELRERFKREGLAAARLSGHPHIVTIFDVGEWRGRPFIVMEHLGGGTLAERLRGAPVRGPQALEWLAETADALDAAHAEGIVHRDVKPANLLFDARELLHVGDFGIARILDDTVRLTMSGIVIGTAGYLSPEQARGQAATAASDVYSLGAVAYELLTGSRPFARGNATAEAAAHANDPFPPPSERNPDLPLAVDDVFERALAKDPESRHATAGELVEDLRAALAAREEPTHLLPVAPPAAAGSSPRRIVPIALVVLALGGGGIAAAVFTAANGGGERVRTVVHRQTVTTRESVEKRVTVTQTLAATPPPPAAPPPPETPAASPSSGQSGSELNLEGYELMQGGRYDEALPILRQAVRRLAGTYRSDFPDEAYADYNLGYTILQLGGCSEALQYLNRSEQLQGHRDEIDAAREDAEACLGGSPGRGKAKGKEKNRR